MTWALEQRLVTEPTTRHVLLCLANYADKNGRGAFPSVASLTQDTGLSERTVRTHLRILESLGVIREGNRAVAYAWADRKDRVPMCYDIVMSSLKPALEVAEERGEADAPRENGTGGSSQQNGGQMTTERGAAAAPNPSPNHQGTEEQLQREAESADGRLRFPMTEEWQPNPEDLAAQTRLMGIPVEAVTAEVVGCFKAHYVALPDIAHTSKRWANELAKWIKRERTISAGSDEPEPWGAKGVKV